MTIAPLSLNTTTALQPLDSLLPLLAATASTTQDLNGFFGASTIVSLSGPGQVLSAASTFQSNLAALQPGSTNSGLGQNFGTDFGSLAAEAQNLVDNFNAVQTTLAGPLAGDALAAQFSQALDAQATATLTNGGSGPATLADIGINLQPGTGTLNIDMQALQAAYQANPSGTFALLGQAAQALGGVAGDFANQAAAESALLSGFGAFGGLGLLLGTGSSNSGTLGITDLLALSSLTSGSASTLTQQLLALNEFNLVSTLMG